MDSGCSSPVVVGVSPAAQESPLLRNYDFPTAASERSHIQDRVAATYRSMHEKQCVAFVRGKKEQWGKLDHAEMTVLEVLEALNQLTDESDPDVDFPNSLHAYQTAERARAAHPDKDWLHLTALLHDLGKVLALWGEPQWSVVGDTFPVGCPPALECVFPQYFADNPDSCVAEYNASKYGMYEPNCGLDNVMFSWGHDEYMYTVLDGNECVTLPYVAKFIIRYHSFYPWHEKGAYMHLCSEQDIELLKWVQEFNRFDLYSKADNLPDLEACQPYYEGLIAKYCPGKLKW